jgi:chromosome segregation protein
VRVLEAEAAGATAAARAAAAASGAGAERARTAQERLAALERGAAARAEDRLDALRRERQGIETELADVAGGRDGATQALYRLGSARERMTLRSEAAATLCEGLRAELAEAEAAARRPGPAPAELEQAANEARASAREAAHRREDLASRAALARERLTALELSLAEREGLPPAARALADDGAVLALSLVDVEPGAERAVAAALGWRASAVVADDPPAGLALLRRARDAGLGSLSVVVGSPARRVAALPVVPLDELLSSTTAAVTPEGFGFDPAAGELWFAGETAEAVLLELDGRRRQLGDEVAELARAEEAAASAAAAAAARAEDAEAAYARVAHLRAARSLDPALLRRLAAGADRLDEVLLAAAATASRLEEPLRRRADERAARAATLGDELARVGGLEHEARREALRANERAAAAELLRARLGGEGQIRLLHVEEAEREEVEREARELAAEAERLAGTAAELAERARSAGAALHETGASRSTLDADLLRRILAGAERLDEALAEAADAASRFEAPLRARVDAGATRTGELGARLRELGAGEVELRQRAEDAAQRATEIEIELTRIDAEAADARRRLDDAAAEPAEGGDRAELAARAERLDARRIQLGQVNPLAKEEHDAEKARLEELETQREDLERSLHELEQLRAELAETVERRFAETFAAVAAHFEEVAATLFPGGEGRLRLVEPDDEEDGEVGVEVELRPAGKKITRLGMLSGGEKALGAISFLFALFLAKPCPFYLLDEVEAALDDANIGRFVELLRRYADRAQFVVITHQKRTMEAADVLYGVTMGGDGVSQVVSRRLPREDAVAASA